MTRSLPFPFFAAGWVLLTSAAMGVIMVAQQPDIVLPIIAERGRVRIAVPDFPGSGVSADVIRTFNSTLWNDLESTGVFEMVSKSFYPKETPERPEDFKPPLTTNAPTNAPFRRLRPGKKDAPATALMGPPMWLTSWSQAPATANVLTFGAVTAQGDRLMLSGWLYDVTKPDIGAAHIFGKRYISSHDTSGARGLAHEFATDILQRLGGGPGIAGSRIYFVSNRTGHKEIWLMDYDGADQAPLTRYNTITMNPAVSPDGRMIAFTTFARGAPSIFLHSLEGNRGLTFHNQAASLNTTPTFSPNGDLIAFSSSLTGRPQLYIADIHGGNLTRISYSVSIDIHPKFNPRTGRQIAFVSDRGGRPQLYLTDVEGTNVRRLTPGDGEAVQPAWAPDGQHIAFAWTGGYEPGNFNIFILEVASGNITQLTFGRSRNEHPSWAFDGRHIVFTSNRTGTSQIWTMLTDGRQLNRLTDLGSNEAPVWAAK